LLYRQKLKPYTLITILRDLVLYKDKIINLKTRPVEVSIKKWSIIINFNILLFRQDKAVLGII
jgi:CTP synthase (UTP-ammonia lyase)